MTRRRLLLVVSAGVLAASLALGAGAWLRWPRTAITRENAAKIHIGMTLAEVEAILGGPPRDDVAAASVRYDFNPDPRVSNRLADELEEKAFGPSDGFPPTLEWRSGEAVVRAQFGDRRVIACAAFPVRPVAVSPIDRLRRWFRL